MLETLATVKGVQNVTSLGTKEEGTTDFLIEPMVGCDIRKDVFERVVSRGKTLLSLSSNKASLEQIFLRLTEADNDEVRRMLGNNDGEEVTDLSDVTFEMSANDVAEQENEEEEN